MKQIKTFLILVTLLIISITSTNAKLYEDAEDENISRWTITDNDPTGAIVKNIYDETRESRVIELNGSSYENEYMIGNQPEEDGAWEDNNNSHLLWKLKNSNGFLIDVILKTSNGIRYIRYSDNEDDLGMEDENIINQGLGYDSANGEWHSFQRDLKADLKEFESNNTLISVEGIKIRGDCKIDDIELTDKNTTTTDVEFITYENAEDNSTARWIITDDEPSGATIRNILDSSTNSRVIELNSSNSYENQYQLGGSWNNQKQFNIKWDMKTIDGFIIDIVVSSTKGERYLRYTDNEKIEKGQDGDIIYHGIGYYATNGKWHTFSRNLAKDLKEIETDNKLLAVNSFTISANCRIDNIELFRNQYKIYEDAEDSKSDRWRVYIGGDGATISNIHDEDKNSSVISLQGDGYNHQYIIGGDGYDNNGWNNTKQKNISWSMKNSDGFIIYIATNTSNGIRYLKYSDNNFSNNGIDGNEIYYGLGYNSADNKWHTFVRDISADIQNFEADNELLSIEGMIVIGSTRIDDLELFNILHPVSNRAGLTLTFDDHNIDGWFSMKDTYLEYGAKATFFVDNFHNLTTDEIDKLKTLELDGHEIGCHTYSHKGIGRDYHYDTTRIDEYIEAQIVPAFNNMKDAGFNPTSLAYPYGEHQKNFDTAVRAYFPYLRTTASDDERELQELNEIYHKNGEHYNILAGDGIDNSYHNEINEIRDALLKARKNDEIITLYAHEVLDDPENHYAISPEKIKNIVQSAKDMGLKFYTFKEAYLVGQ